jgi:phenylacetate-CoA ligase
MNKSVAAKIVLPVVYALRHEAVLASYRHLTACEDLDQDRYDQYRYDKLAAMVAHAELNFSYYRSRFADHGVRATALRTTADLSRFPLLAKSDLADLRRCALDAPGHRGPLVMRKTAGSSGEPAVVVADAAANSLSLAARRRYYGWHGIQPGDRELRFWGRPLSGSAWKSRVKNAVLNRMPVDSQRLSKLAWPATLASIVRFRPDYAYGYTSLISLFSECLRDGKATDFGFALKAAICTSETSTTTERSRIGEILGCRVLNEYGCSEIDIIAFECPGGGLHVVGENVVVEVIDERGEPADRGEIVVTDLNNRAMPLIRYRIGDVGALSRTSCRCGRVGPCLASIEGRLQGQYLVAEDGTRLHSQTIAYMFEDLVHAGLPIRRFRIVQETSRFVRILVAADALDPTQSEKLRQLVAVEFKKLAGDRFQMEIEMVEDRELIQDGKKYRHFESRVS